MIAPASSRRGIICGFAVLPMAGRVAGASAAPSHDLLRLVEQFEAAHTEMRVAQDAEGELGHDLDPNEWRRLCRVAAECRSTVALAPCHSLADVSLKLRALRSMEYDRTSIREEVESACADWCYGEALMMAVVADLMGLQEAGLCTGL